jgi:S-formylglutathione hydrolase FrmB
MKRTALLVLAGAAAALAFGAVDARSAARRQDGSFASAAIGGRLHFEVYLPAGYADSRVRYPVLYALHGLPSGPTAYTGLGFVERALEALGRPAILVVPQAARAGDSDPEYLDRGPGEGWQTAVAIELPRIIDARYRTLRSRSGRALIGISAGGYGAMHLALLHLGEFSVVESWSGYFHPTDPTGTRPLELGSPARDLAADVHHLVSTLSSSLKTTPTFIAFYVGRGDRRFYAENEILNQELSAAGIGHVFRAYPGGHDQQLWQRYAGPWLELALMHLAPAH